MPDVAAATVDGGVQILLGEGDGSLQAAQKFAAGLAPRALAVSDFNGDGRLDLATANSTGNSVSVLLGNGDGSFKAKFDYATATQPVALASCDFDADGKPDLATAGTTP